MNSPFQEPFHIEGGATLGRTLHGWTHWPSGPGPHPWTVVVHGFKGFMDWGFFPLLCERLQGEGIAAVRFNLSGSGVLPGSDRFDDQDAFAHNTYGAERSDVETVLRWVTGDRSDAESVPRFDPLRGSLFGHSRGGGIALLCTARHPELAALVTWASIDDVDRFDEATKRDWRATGALHIPNARTGQIHRIERDLLDEITQDQGDLDLLAACAAIRAPACLVHGSADRSVPISASRRLHAALSHSRLLEIEDAGHTFEATHPLSGVPAALETALERTVQHLREHLHPRSLPAER